MFGIKIKIPNGQTKEIEAVETYIVHWYSCDCWSSMYADKKEHYQGFTDIDKATAFKTSLEQAHMLLGNSGSITNVVLTKQRSGL